jgi:hypothetical protein
LPVILRRLSPNPVGAALPKIGVALSLAVSSRGHSEARLCILPTVVA